MRLPVPASTDRIPSLDGLRAISILLVIVGHLTKPRGLGLAIFGVQVFFVISGYLITSLLQKEYRRNGRISLSGFYQRRCFRILPAAYAYILVIAIAVPATRISLPYALTYTVSCNPNGVANLFSHLWSLSIEEQFYLLWPLALVISFRRRAFVAWTIMALAAAFRLVVSLRVLQLPLVDVHFFPLGAMDSIAAGCLLAIYEPIVRARIGWMSQFPAIAMAVPLTAWILNVICFDGTPTAIWGIVPLLLAVWVFLQVERKDWILNNCVAVTIGLLSYSLYLWQQPFTTQAGRGVVLKLASLAGCAMASYFLVEKPMLKLEALLREKNPARPSPTAVRVRSAD